MSKYRDESIIISIKACTNQLINEKNTWLFRGLIGDEIAPSYVGIKINHYIYII